MEDFIGFSHYEGMNSFPVNVEFHDDGYNWKKYGYKQVKDFLFTRSYYMCTHQDCAAKKNVVHSLDGSVTELSYKGNHNHQPSHPNKLTSNEISNMKGKIYSTYQIQCGSLNRLKEVQIKYVSSHPMFNLNLESRKTIVEHVSRISERQEVGGQEVVEKNDEPGPKRR